MIKVFLDASVIIAGLYSPTGGSALILRLIEKNKIIGLTSQAVLGEVQRNVVKKMPEKVKYYTELTYNGNITVLDYPDKKDVSLWYDVIEAKDAHVLASCVKSKADFLVTLDRKHFMLPDVQKEVPFKIVTPKELIEQRTR